MKTKFAMRYLICILLLIHWYSVYLKGQSISSPDAILNYLQVDDLQNLDQSEVERLEHLLDSPARINVLSEVELRRTGLFSTYQIAVISDYLSRHGSIMSLAELSLLDGFGETFVRRIAPFVSLAIHDRSSGAMTHQLAVRGSVRWQEDDGNDGSYGVKYRLESDGSFTAMVAASRSVGAKSWSPSAYTGSFSWKFKRLPARIVVGDFNARFGQGLVLWNNSFLNSLTTPDTFMKKPSGLTQTWSFTGSGSLHGAGTEISLGSIQVCALAAFEDFKCTPALNLSWYSRYGQLSLTSTMSKTGADAAYCVRGINLFGEVAYDWTEKNPSALLGSRFKAGECMDMAVLSRMLLNDRYGFAIGGEYSFGTQSNLSFTADATKYHEQKDKDDLHSIQLKCLLSCEFAINSSWLLKLRLSERLRTWGLPTRTDVRTDIIYKCNLLVCTMRMNVLNCDKTGFLSYVEGGHAGEKMSLYLRQGIFFIDDWDDRIYVYERDAPGSFNVPAMYGRGLWTGMTVSAKMSSAFRLYARASYVGYPFMEKKKPGKAELKLQLQYRF